MLFAGLAGSALAGAAKNFISGAVSKFRENAAERKEERQEKKEEKRQEKNTKSLNSETPNDSWTNFIKNDGTVISGDAESAATDAKAGTKNGGLSETLKKIPTWVWIAGGVLLLTGGDVGSLLGKKKRRAPVRRRKAAPKTRVVYRTRKSRPTAKRRRR